MSTSNLPYLCWLAVRIKSGSKGLTPEEFARIQSDEQARRIYNAAQDGDFSTLDAEESKALAAAIEAGPSAPKPEDKAERGWGDEPTSVMDLINSPDEIEWLFEGLLARGEVCVLGGDGGTGKSAFLLHTAALAACGRAHHVFKSRKPLRILGFFLEDSKVELKRRLSNLLQHLSYGQALTDYERGLLNENFKIFSASHRIDDYELIIGRPQGPEIRKDALDRLAKAAKSCDLIILDTRGHFLDAGAADDRAVGRFGRVLAGIARDSGCSFITTVHTNKSKEHATKADKVLGSVMSRNSVRLMLLLGRETENLIHLEVVKSNNLTQDQRNVIDSYYQIERGVFQGVSKDAAQRLIEGDVIAGQSEKKTAKIMKRSTDNDLPF